MSVSAAVSPDRTFGLAVTYEGGDAAFLERLTSLVDYVEVSPDGMARKSDGRARLDERSLENLRNIVSGKKLLVHGVGLS